MKYQVKIITYVSYGMLSHAMPIENIMPWIEIQTLSWYDI